MSIIRIFKKNITAALLVLLAFTAAAQTAPLSSNKQAQKLYVQAGKSISYRLYDEAAAQLQEAVKLDPGFISAWQQLGDVSRKLQNYEQAELSYWEVLKINPEFHALTYFGLAESLLNQGKYHESLKYFIKYRSLPGLSDNSRKLAEKYIDDCNFSIEAIKNPVAFIPKNLGPEINTKDQEYLPSVTADEEMLIFTRQANRNENFFKSDKRDTSWKTAVYLSGSINTEKYNEGAQCISPDGMYLFFTGCNRPDGLGRCDIYVSRREGSSWGEPFNIGPPINTPGWESQPSLSADGRTLYFVSTRPGGYGGYDIWRSELLEGGAWSDPVNLGPNINTAFDEQSPFIHHDGVTLYFSSNGWPGLGNKDLFFSRKDSIGWQKPQNLGYPINTFKEESSLTISSDGRTAFFASDKEKGFGGLDIYSFQLPEKLRPLPVTYVKGVIIDKATKEPLAASIQLVNLNNEEVLYDDYSDHETGSFLAVMPAGKLFGLHASKEGYLFHSENFSLDKPGTHLHPFQMTIELQQIKAGEKSILKNIFFDTNKFELLPESETELKQLIAFLKANPRVSIEIGGHTDNTGEDKANQKLSENRAKTVYSYLVDQGISASRLTYKGYGENLPAASNSSAEGRQANRRTEFKILNY